VSHVRALPWESHPTACPAPWLSEELPTRYFQLVLANSQQVETKL